MYKPLSLLLALLFLAPVAHAQLTVPQGGTGRATFPTTQIPYGGGVLRLDREAAFTYDETTNRFSVTYASTTALSATTLCLGGDCQTSWPSGGTGFSTTSANFWATLGLAFSTTSADYWETQQAARGGAGGFSTTSNNYWASLGLAFSSTSAAAYETAFGDWDVSSGFLTPTTTLGIDVNATSTITALSLNTTANVSASESTGGVLLINRGSALGPAAVIYTNAGVGGGRAVSIVSDNTAYDTQALHVRSDSITETTLNVLGSPAGKGIIKVAANGVADANGSTISADASTSGYLGQLFFGICGTSTICTQIRDSGGTNQMFTLLGSGNLGLGTSSPYAKLSVVGQVVARYFTATSSTASTFPYASSTAISATTICISTDCRTSWPAGGSGTSPFSTTTSNVSGTLEISPLNTSDILTLGADSTTTAEFWFDPNTNTSQLGNAGSGDATLQFGPTSNEWAFGYDETNKSFVISSSTVLGTNNALAIAKGGVLTFTNASSTVVSATAFCLTGDDCITTWPSGGGVSGSNWEITSGLLTPTTTIGIDLNATSTITALSLNTTNGVSASQSVGGVLNINRGTALGPAAVFYNNSGTGGGRLVSVVCDNTALDTQCLHLASDSSIESTLNILGGPAAKGIVKIGSNAVGDSDSAALSIDSSLASYVGAGIFLKGNATGKLVNIRGSDNAEYMTLLPNGNLGLASTSPYAKLSVAGEVVANRFTATSTANPSRFTNASTTITSATTLCISTDCRTSWPAGGEAFSTTSADYWKTQNTFESITAGDALTRTANDIDFDGGATPSGDLGGTWAAPSVTDDSHAHTASSISGLGTADISGLDISDDTNLTAGTNITLTGDDLSVDDAFLLNTGDTGTGLYTFANSSTTVASFGYASSTLYYGAGLTNCSSANKVTWTDGRFGCETDSVGGAAASDFSFSSNYGAVNAATSSIVWAQNGINASSTSHFVNASTTRLSAAVISGVGGSLSLVGDDSVTMSNPTVSSIVGLNAVGPFLGSDVDGFWAYFNTDDLTTAKTFTFPDVTGTFCIVQAGNCPSFSTTSANVWSGFGLGFSTTSTNYWKTQNTFEAITAGDGLTRTADDIDFDGGTAPAGALGGTWASPTVDDDGHAHTASTISGLGTADISGLDISDDTNLTAGDGITLNADDLDCDTATAAALGCLTAADWTLFNNKVSSTSIDTIGEVETIWGVSNILVENDIDASTELAAIMDDETGSGALVFAAAPTLTGVTTMANASTTILSGTTLCISTDCRTSWPSAGGASTDKWATTTNGLAIYPNTPTTDVVFGGSSTATAPFWFDTLDVPTDDPTIYLSAFEAGTVDFGQVRFQGAHATATDATGVSILFDAGNGLNGANASGGEFSFEAGNGVLAGGQFNFSAGSASADDAFGGEFTMNGGDTTGANAFAGGLTMNAGDSSGAGSYGGALTFNAGNGGGEGGSIQFSAGNGSTVAGGDVGFTAGNGNAGTDGSITFRTDGGNTLAMAIDGTGYTAIGGNQYLGAALRDQLNVKGRVNTEGWNYSSCDKASHSGVASAASHVCGQLLYFEDTTNATPPSLQSVGNTAEGYAYESLVMTAGCAGCGNGLWVGGTNGNAHWMGMGTSTPVMEMSARINPTTSTTTRYYMGFTNVDFNAGTYEAGPTAGCYFAASSTKANWQSICQTSASAITQVDTGVASSTSVTALGGWRRFRIEATGSSVSFYIQSTEAGALTNVATISTNIPKVGTTPGVLVAYVNGGAASSFHVMRIRVWWKDFLPSS